VEIVSYKKPFKW